MFNRKKITVSGPKPKNLSINRNVSGVPLIKANSLKDVLWGSGYAHVIDRSTQLLMMRILGQGRLCELLSDTEDSLKIDHFFRKANWVSSLDEEVAKLDGDSLSLCQSYCDGVNAGLAHKKVSAMKLLGYHPEPWCIQDSILVSRMASYLTLAQSQAEVERLFIELVQAGISSEKLAALFPIDLSNFDRELIESVQLGERVVPQELIWNLALPRMMASNNWVISGSKTTSGQAIMANDPHLEINRLPNVWCEQSLVWSDNFVKGMGMPGLPGIIIGRSKDIAWGVTYTFMDTIDSWVEECKNGKYKRGRQWLAFEKRTEIIKRKKHADEMLHFYENKHGVLDGNPFEAGRYLSTKWAADNMGAASLMTSLNLTKATNAKEAAACLAKMESAWNWVIADEQNNIVYQMSGVMPKRHESWNGFTPMPGWDAQYDWQGMVATSELPCIENPEQGFIVTANQDLNHFGKCSPINMPMGDYRARRIAQLIEQSDLHDVISSQKIQFDVYSIQAEEFLAILLPLLANSSELGSAHTVLKNWNCEYDLESIAASLFEDFYSALRMEVFGANKSGIGNDVMRHLSTQTGVFIDFYQNFDRVLLNPDSPWFSQEGHDSPSQSEAFLNAFKIAKRKYKAIPWKAVNSIIFTNMLFQGKLPEFMGFDTPPVPIIGGRATPHQGQLYKSSGRQTSFGPSIRIVSDLSEKTLYTCLAGGPSDNRFSPWYLSELEAWQKGIYKKLD
ncbi:MAG: penicillin amidase [Oleiphilaceae bacterium]|jgi:penicillin amidase